MRQTIRRRITSVVSATTLVGSALAGALLGAPTSAGAAPAPTGSGVAYKVLVFTKSTAEQHVSTTAGVTAIKQLGTQYRFNVDVTDDARKFDETHLKLYRAVVFLNTS